MTTPISTAAWNVPVTLSSMEVLTSGTVNNLMKDVGYLYARPYIFAYATAGATMTFIGTTPADVGSANNVLLLAAGSGSYTNTPATYATYGLSGGVITLPNTVPGLYRVTAQMMVSTGTTGHARIVARTADAAAATGFWTAGQFATQISQGNTIATLDCVIPFGLGAFPLTKNRLYVYGQCVAANMNIQAVDQSAQARGPATSPPAYNTWVMVEYLGNSYGAYAN